MERPARPSPLEHAIADPVRTGRRRVLITGAGGQLGAALAEEFGAEDVVAVARSDWDVTQRAPAGLGPVDLALHAAAWTNVDGAEASPEGALNVNAAGTRNVVALGAPVVYYSSDYVFDGAKGEPYVESDRPAPASAYGRSKLAGEREIRRGWIVRSSWLFGWTGHNFVRTMLRLGAEREEVAVVDDQRGSPTYVGHLASATRGAGGAAGGNLARRGRRRVHVGGVRGGDLRRRWPRLPRASDLDRRAGPARAATRVFAATQ